MLEPGAFGAVQITKSLTIDGDGTLASLNVTGVNGITVNGADIVVTIRNLSLFSIGASPQKGISLLNGAAVIIDHVAISGFETGVETTVGNATVINSTITQATAFGVRALGGSISVENSMLANNSVAVQSQTGATVNLVNSGIYNNLTGFGCGGGILASTGNNRKANNTGGVVATCNPDTVILFK